MEKDEIIEYLRKIEHRLRNDPEFGDCIHEVMDSACEAIEFADEMNAI